MWLVDRLDGRTRRFAPADLTRASADPWGDDLQLTLHLIHELSSSGVPGVSDQFEDDLVINSIRVELESAFERALTRELADGADRHDRHDRQDGHDGSPGDVAVGDEVNGIDEVNCVIETVRTDILDDPESLAAHLLGPGTVDQLRELLVHWSVRYLDQTDPYSWGLPRLAGRARAALLEIQADDQGIGRPGPSHADLFAATMSEFGLDTAYGSYVDHLPAATLATTNLTRMFGGSRRLIGALVGHLTVAELTSVEPMVHYASAVSHFGGSEAARAFFDSRAVGDAHHEPMVLDSLLPDFLGRWPDRAADVVFGARAFALVERRFVGEVLDSWRDGRSSLRPVE